MHILPKPLVPIDRTADYDAANRRFEPLKPILLTTPIPEPV
ncbi:hypothetical protein ACWDV4_12555 [Micromonospora sp. NPDC003197]